MALSAGEGMSFTKAHSIANARRIKRPRDIQLKGDNFSFVTQETDKFLETQLAFPKPKRTKGRGCRVSDRDEAAKARLGYTNPRSFVRLDGSEVLYGEDWKKRKQEIWERGAGRCERLICPGGPSDAPMKRCQTEMHDPHHIIKRSKRRDDRTVNLVGLCRMHHDLQGI